MRQTHCWAAPLLFIGRMKDSRLVDASLDVCEDEDVCEGETEAGALLADLERRQDDVLAHLDALDQRLSGLLRGLGVTLVDDAEATGRTLTAGAGAIAERLSEGDTDGDNLGAFAEEIRCASSHHDPEDADVPMDVGGAGFAKLPCDALPVTHATRARDRWRPVPQQTRSARAA